MYSGVITKQFDKDLCHTVAGGTCEACIEKYNATFRAVCDTCGITYAKKKIQGESNKTVVCGTCRACIGKRIAENRNQAFRAGLAEGTECADVNFNEGYNKGYAIGYENGLADKSPSEYKKGYDAGWDARTKAEFQYNSKKAFSEGKAAGEAAATDSYEKGLKKGYDNAVKNCRQCESNRIRENAKGLNAAYKLGREHEHKNAMAMLRLNHRTNSDFNGKLQHEPGKVVIKTKEGEIVDE